MAKTIDDILQKYYGEANRGVVQKAPSTLNRGEGTVKEYFIYKIDLVGSTIFTWSRSHQTYLKMAHTFLSSVDEITRCYGADDNQVEYAGDSVIAYFPKSVGAINVLAAAYDCRNATLRMKSLDATLRKFPYHTKTVVHFGKLIMAKIGPHGDSMVTAIGPELHKACKMEKNISAGEGRASKEFMGQLEGREKFLLRGNFKETQVLKQPESSQNTAGLFAETLNRTLNPRNLLGLTPNDLSSSLASQYVTERELIDYSIKWDMIQKYFEKHRK